MTYIQPNLTYHTSIFIWNYPKTNLDIFMVTEDTLIPLFTLQPNPLIKAILITTKRIELKSQFCKVDFLSSPSFFMAFPCFFQSGSSEDKLASLQHPLSHVSVDLRAYTITALQNFPSSFFYGFCFTKRCHPPKPEAPITSVTPSVQLQSACVSVCVLFGMKYHIVMKKSVIA